MMKFIKGGLIGHEPSIQMWDPPTIRYFDGNKIEGRPTKGYGSAPFEYAGKRYEPTPWTNSMNIIKTATELLIYKHLGQVVRFNFCLCGLYRNGKVSIPHHSDTVPTTEDLVVSISFGAPRIFQWCEYSCPIKKETNTSELDISIDDQTPVVRNYIMEEGDVFIFDGHSQMNSTHSVPSVENKEERINLTFRTGI